jgi:thiol-disulfide isomerase/thioredoxin
VRLHRFRGKVVVLNLWAAWCAPCIEEMPSLDRLAARLPAADFAVIAVSQDKTGAAAAGPAFRRLDLASLKLHLDPERKLSAELGVRGMPTTVIFDAEGRAVSYREGAAVWDSDKMVSYLLSLARKPRNPA